MKNVVFGILLSIIVVFCNSCGETKIQVNGMQSTVRSVISGNQIELQSGTKVVLLGVKNSENGKKYLEKHVKGKKVVLISDSHQPQFISSHLTTVHAYVRVVGEKGCVQNKILQSRLANVNTALDCDSLQSFVNACKAKQHPLMTSSELNTYMKPATFAIYTENSVGTGFFINDNGLALTNNHVLDGTEDAIICFFGEDGKLDRTNVHPINRIIKTFSDGDKIDYTIFIVHLDNGVKCSYMPLVEHRANDGEDIAKLGCPVGEIGNFQTGVLSNYNEGYITHSIASNHGDSGGPIVNFRGEVVGINQSIQFNYNIGEQAKGIAYAVDALYIRNILDNLGIEYGR